MRFNLFLHSLFLLLLFSVFTCDNDSSNPLGLQENEITYFLDSGTERIYKATCTIEKVTDYYTLSIKGSNKSDGILITADSIKNFQTQKLSIVQDVVLLINERKSDNELCIYLSTACGINNGSFEIVEWNEKEKTITGIFNGPMCTKGVFAHLPNTKVSDGAFYKLKYNVK